jgi:hypothetical protein
MRGPLCPPGALVAPETAPLVRRRSTKRERRRFWGLRGAGEVLNEAARVFALTGALVGRPAAAGDADHLSRG